MIALSYSTRMDLVALTESIFADGGYLEEAMGFNHRQQQSEMAYYSAQSFEADSALIFEAGTGVGKTLAYLIPAIIYAKQEGRQVFISTHTKALQEQIINKDLPFIREFFAKTEKLSEYADFKEAVLFGRNNYLCTNRLSKAISEKADLFMSSQEEELIRISNWALSTQTGLKSELSPPPDEEVWNWVNADSSLCTKRKCEKSSCYYQSAKRKMASADVVILNHSLVFSLMASGQGVDGDTKGILLANDFFVFDEAHLLPDVATDNFGMELSDFSIMRHLKRIYNPKTKRGLFRKLKYSTKYDIEHLSNAIVATENFFAGVRVEYLKSKDSASLVAEAWADTEICLKLRALKQCLDTLAAKANTESEKAEIDDYAKKTNAICLALEDAIFLSDKKQVYWLEKYGKMGDITKIQSAPLDVSKILRVRLFGKGVSVVLTSATLSYNGEDVDKFSGKVGGEIAQTNIVKSPFDYKKNMRVLLSRQAPSFDANKKMNAKYISDCISKISKKITGGILVLFTSYSELNDVAKILQEEVKDRRIFTQGSYDRSELIHKFREQGNGILLGTDSFWTGIDIKGEALSAVVIAKLPFANPSHPLMQAKSQLLENEGINPFMEIFLPESIMKFRQGFGRLIRSESDKGLVVVLDDRILTKPYGKSFISALPISDYETFDLKNLDIKLNNLNI